jgi:hypothetical protein
MVGGTYASTAPGGILGWAKIAGAQSSEELLREYAAKDTDFDGLPDWQEALYGTDPANPESFQAGIKDGDAVAQGLIEPKVAVRPEDEPTDIDEIPGTVAAPSTLTDRFAQTLLKQFLMNRGDTPPTSAEIADFVEAGVADLSQQAASPARFSFSETRASSDTGAAALSAYAGRAETAFAENTVPADRNELFYFEEAMKGDTEALGKIGQISEAYTDIAEALVATPVPSEARQAHLAIANALAHLSETSADMAAMEEDPLRALMGIGLYRQYADELIAAFANLHGVLSARQVSIPEGTPGYYVAKTAADAAAARQ